VARPLRPHSSKRTRPITSTAIFRPGPTIEAPAPGHKAAPWSAPAPPGGPEQSPALPGGPEGRRAPTYEPGPRPRRVLGSVGARRSCAGTADEKKRTRWSPVHALGPATMPAPPQASGGCCRSTPISLTKGGGDHHWPAAPPRIQQQGRHIDNPGRGTNRTPRPGADVRCHSQSRLFFSPIFFPTTYRHGDYPPEQAAAARPSPGIRGTALQVPPGNAVCFV